MPLTGNAERTEPGAPKHPLLAPLDQRRLHLIVA